MLSKRFLLRLGSVLLIVFSFAWCFYVIVNHQAGEGSTARGMFVQNQASGSNISPRGRSFAQGPNQPGSQAAGENNVRSGSRPNGRVPGNGSFQADGHANSQRSFNQGTAPMNGRMRSGGQNYTVPILLYASLFFAAVIAAYFVWNRRKSGPKMDSEAEDKLNSEISVKSKFAGGNQTLIILTLFFVGLFLRIALGLLIEGHPFDLNTFKTWATSAANNFSQFYSGSHTSDYPPLYIYILYLVGKIGSLQAMSPYFTILLKLPSILADLATALLLYKLARKHISAGLGILAAAFYIFNPAVLVNSTIWGQVDSFFTLLVAAAVVLVAEEKIGLSTVFFTAAVLMKPQGIIFLPVLFFELVRRRNWKSTVKVLLTAVVTALIIILPFSVNQSALWIFKLYTSTVGEYPYASVNAYNFFYLLGGNYLNDKSIFLLFSYHAWGLTFIVLVTLLAWLTFAKGKNRILAPAAALILISGVFIFATSMHERYLFPAAALAALVFIYTREKRFILLSTGFSVTIFINTYEVFCQANGGISRAGLSTLPALTALLNLILFVYLIKVMYDLTLKRNSPFQTFRDLSSAEGTGDSSAKEN